MTTFLHMSLAGGAAVIVAALVRYIVLHQLGGAFGHYSGRVMKFIWLLILVRLLLPVTIETNIPAPEFLTENIEPQRVEANDVGPYNQTIVYGTEKSASDRIDLSDIPILPLIWAVGCIGVASLFARSYMRIRHSTRQTSPVSEDVERGFMSLAESLDIRRAATFYADVDAPVCVGFFRPRVLLPYGRESLGDDEMDCVLCHELWHIKRRDNLFKLLCCIAVCLHWFNPAVWLMLTLANRDVELACDERVLDCLNVDPKTYALCLIRAQEQKLGTAVSFGGSLIDERIRSIMNKRKKFTLAGAALLAVLISASAITFIGASQPKGDAANRTVKPYRAVDEADTPDIDEASAAYETESETSEQTEAGSFEETAVIVDFPDDNPNMQYTFPLVDGAELTLDFGPKQTPVGTTIYHSGVDLAAESGDDILAAIDGKVTAVGYDNDKGYYVVIANDAGFEVEYNHCKDVYVESGDTVEAGQVVASVGTTGSATGAHLHFEVRENGVAIDPKLYYGFGIN